jgi:hypothetical protein
MEDTGSSDSITNHPDVGKEKKQAIKLNMYLSDALFDLTSNL